MKKQLQAFAIAHKYNRAFDANMPVPGQVQDVTAALQNMIKQYPRDGNYFHVLKAADKTNLQEMLHAVFQGVIECGISRKDGNKPNESSEITHLINAIAKKAGVYTDQFLREDENFRDTFRHAGKYLCASQEKALFENTLTKLNNLVDAPVKEEGARSAMS
jgi:hypothetical protein